MAGRFVNIDRETPMREGLGSPEGRALYARRQVVSESVFAAIKNALGFRRFNLRGSKLVEGEWRFVALAYNCRAQLAESLQKQP
jgi:hypothetical protein